MAQHYLLSAKARTLSIVKIAMMPDEEIHNIFKQIRWSANDGKTVCPHCVQPQHLTILELEASTDVKNASIPLA